jgi:ferredoxin
MESGSPDPYYTARREATAVFVMEPQRVAEGAFWSSFDSSHLEHGFDFFWHGFDLYWTRISPAAFFVQIGSPLGESLLLSSGARGTIERATSSEREAAKQARLRVWAEARKNRLGYDWREVPKVLSRSWTSPLWRQRSSLCLGCGSCNLVCPTCYCFDIKDEVDDKLETGVRYREWDACMLESFARVAGGHNFREKARQRYRHRYFRKGKYIFDKLGELGCVGCGRCVKACTARIANPLAVFNELWEASRHES